jgi:hypothetical protein
LILVLEAIYGETTALTSTSTDFPAATSISFVKSE